jgi:hypothetical protein
MLHWACNVAIGFERCYEEICSDPLKVIAAVLEFAKSFLLLAHRLLMLLLLA